MKKRPSDSHNSPLKATHDFNEDVTLIETRALDNQESSSENTTPRLKVSMGTDNESFDDSVNTFTKHDELDDSTDFGELKSSCSLPKVDEDKESLEFTISKSPFDHRRSKSSCNITTVNTAESTPQKDEKRQSRRMSDTILSDKPAPHHTHSPSKRFIRKIFSPMVCGVPSPDRRHLFTNNGSLLSLGSYDSASVISDHEQDAYPQLFDFGSHELMEEMTLIDKELLVRIPWGELSILGWMSTDKYIIAPNIMKMVEFFNRVVMMVTTSILSEENVYRRAKIIQKAIKLALKFRYQKNFNSLKAVLGGLQCTPIFRLKQTWKQVPSRYRRVFRELSELMSEENNFYNYRMVLRESMEKPPCIPFLGNFLTTVAHTHAFVSVNYKYKKDSAIESGGESDSNRTSPSPTNSPHEVEDESSNKNSELDKQINPCLRSSTSKIHSATHMRTDSDDSGVVLNVHRLSRSSDDLETSPREESLSSPDDDGRVRFHEEVFDKKNSQQDDEKCFCPSNQETEKAKKPRFSDTDLPSTTTTSSTPNPTRTQLSVGPRHRRSVSEIIMSPTRHHSRSISDAGIRNANDINNVINNRPVAGKENSGLYTCELQFWKYQINAVQYKIIPKSYIRRYLMNCPYNTEEVNYKLSLKREPPAPR